MEVARTSMIHAAAPHFRWPFAVRYAAHQLNLWACVSLPETSPMLRWTGKIGDASLFQFYHPTLRRVLLAEDVTFVESVPFYCLFPYRTAPLPPSPHFLAPGLPPVDPLPPQEPGGAEHEGAEPGGAESEGAESESAEPGGAEPGSTEPEGVELGGAESEGAESGGTEPRGTASAGGPAGASPRLSPRQEPLSPQQLREWFDQRTHLRSGAAGAGGSAAGGTGVGGAGEVRLGGAGVTARAGGIRGAVAAGPGGARNGGTDAVGARARGAGAGDPGAGGAGAGGTDGGGAGAGGTGDGDSGAGETGARGAGAGGAGAGDPGAGGAGARGAKAGGTGAGGTVQRRPFFVPLPPSSLPPPDLVLRQSRPASPIRAVCTGRRVPCPRPSPVPSTHIMALRPSAVPLRVPLPPPPASSLSGVPDPESDLAHTASPAVPRLLTTVVTDPSFESTTASALVAELVEFATACRLDYATSLVAESESACPPSVGGEWALGTVVLEDTQEEFECLAAA
ncbi:unnamed protein product, partial [Closterium sp. NIES-53]